MTLDTTTPDSVTTRRRRTAGVLLVAVTLIVLVGVLLRAWSTVGGEVNPLVPPAGERGVESASRGELVAIPDPGGSVPNVTSTREEAGSLSPSGREEGPAPFGSVEIELVDEEQGAPVPGARVHFVGWDRLSEIEKRGVGFFAIDADSLARERGHERTSDAEGMVRIPGRETGAIVVAEKGSLQGREFLRPQGPGRVRMVLRVGAEVRVRVVDDRGAPVAGVPVGLRVGKPGRETFLGSVKTEEPDGEARLRNARSAIDRLDEPRCAVALSFPHTPVVEVLIDPEALSTTPIRLVLPPTGAVEVLVEGANGERRDSRDLVGLHDVSPSRSGKDGHPFLNYAEPGDGRSPSVATYPHVGLGLELEAMLLELDGGEDTAIRFPGPVEAGEVVRVTVRAREGLHVPVLTGRLLDETGRPWSSRRVEAQCELEDPHSGSRFSRERTLEIDEEGRFRWPLEIRHGLCLAVHFRVRWGEGRTLLAGSVSVEEDLSPGEYPLGTVFLRSIPVLFAGRVVDEIGTPVPDASLMLLRRDGFVVDGGWSKGGHVSTTTDARGRFVIHGEPVAGESNILAWHATHHPLEPDRRYAAGNRDITITLARSFVIEGRMLLDRDVPVSAIEVFVHPEGAPRDAEEAVRRHPIRPEEDGRFRHASPHPGTFVVRGCVATTGEEVFQIDGIHLPPASGSKDVVLEPIDLRGRVHAIRLRVEDRARNPLREASIHIGEGKHERTLRVRSSGPRPGTFEIWTLRDTFEGWAMAPRCRRASFEAGIGETTVTLDASLRTRLHLVGLPWHEFPDVRFRGRLVWRGEGPSKCELRPAELGLDPAAVEVGAPGPYAFSIVAELTDADQFDLVAAEEILLEITEEGADPIEVEAQVEAVRRTVEELRRRRDG